MSASQQEGGLLSWDISVFGEDPPIMFTFSSDEDLVAAHVTQWNIVGIKNEHVGPWSVCECDVHCKTTGKHRMCSFWTQSLFILDLPFAGIALKFVLIVSKFGTVERKSAQHADLNKSFIASLRCCLICRKAKAAPNGARPMSYDISATGQLHQ